MEITLNIFLLYCILSIFVAYANLSAHTFGQIIFIYIHKCNDMYIIYRCNSLIYEGDANF